MIRRLGQQGGEATRLAAVGILSIIAAAVIGGAALCQCATCGGGMSGLGVEQATGETWVEPVTAGVDVGPGAPGRCDATHLPLVAGARNFGTPSAPQIRWGTSRITLDQNGGVLVDGALKYGWTWNATTKTLTTPEGRMYVFNSDEGMLTSSSGPSGLQVTTYTYDTTYPDRLASVTDSFGNTWTFGVDYTKPGPSYIVNPDETRKVEYSYVAYGSNGAGQYSQVKVYKKDGENWAEQEHTDYTYNPDHTVASISTADFDDQQSPSVTSVSYSSGLVSRVENDKFRIDVTFGYDSTNIDQTDGTHPYGVVTVRRRHTYGSDSDQSDLITRYYYYRTANGKNQYLFKAVPRIYSGGSLTDYSTTEYRRYGYNGRFPDADKPTTDPAELRGQPWKVVDARGNPTKYEYSTDNGLVTKVTLPTADYTQYWYNKDGQDKDTVYVEKVRDSRGKYTGYVRGITGHPEQVTEVQVADSVDGSGNLVDPVIVQQMSYYTSPSQKAGLLHTVTVPDIEGDDDMVTTYDYQETIGSTVYYRPNPTTQTYAWWNGSTYVDKHTTTSYYKDGRLRWDGDALNHRTDYTYDAELKLTDTWFAADAADTGSVDAATSAQITDNSMTWLDNQLVGMSLELADANGVYSGDMYPVTENTDKTVTVSRALPASITGRAYRVRPYDEVHYQACCGLADEERDGRGKKTYYEYDTGRLTEVRNDVTGENGDPLVEYVYNDLGQTTSVSTYTDDAGTPRTTSYTYDQLGQMTKVVHPYNSTEADLLWNEYYQYNKSGMLVAKLVGTVSGTSITNGDVKVYEYDALGRLVEVKHDYYGQSSGTWPVSCDSYGDISITGDVSYEYEGGSFLKTEMVDASGTSSYTYDTQGRLATYTPPVPADYSVQYGWNTAGEKTWVRVKQSGTNKYQSTYSYFRNGWLKQAKGQEWVSGAWSDVTKTDFAYDEAGRRTDRKNGLTANDIQTDYQYNARYETTRVRHWNSGKTTQLYSMTYRRDGLGNPLAVDFSGNNCPTVYQDKTVAYEYDAVSRLASEQVGTGDPTTWSYDWVGNRGAGSDYDKADMYRRGSGYEYDYLGNLEYVPDPTSAKRTRYYYDGDNLLSQVDDVVNDVAAPTTITWDADQQRVKLQRGESAWEFVYDPSAGVPAILWDNHDSRIYFREPGGELLASYAGSAARNYHFDDLGSVVLASNNSGTVSDNYAYGAWGDPVDDGALPYRYVGQLGYYAHSTAQGTALADLTQLGVRLYDRETGRFAQRDPISSVTSEYAYVRGMATTFTDPSGRKLEWLFGDGQICVHESCYGKKYFPGGIASIPSLGGSNKTQPLPKAPCPTRAGQAETCANTDAIYVPPGTAVTFDGAPQPPSGKVILKISGGWACHFTCLDKPAPGQQKIKLTCRMYSRLLVPRLYPPQWVAGKPNQE